MKCSLFSDAGTPWLRVQERSGDSADTQHGSQERRPGGAAMVAPDGSGRPWGALKRMVLTMGRLLPVLFAAVSMSSAYVAGACPSAARQ
ncbi:hypothetical protein NDU88_003328 [Pleurodeles waltl]|uniref:Uncharacterized protein n=1 Tax=Pleurodeles waltl TaxID=8319 RepID=A0AAV7VHJ4_PLEWA|nr:hypothetical protein NDU88_003328 [Pleurodeles waltl]